MITFKNAELFINAMIILLSLFAVVYTLGVVWRVEKKLDLSYKLFLIAILAFFASILIEILNPVQDSLTELAASLMKMLFAAFFLAGVFTMRNMIRKIDGEKKNFPFDKFRDKENN